MEDQQFNDKAIKQLFKQLPEDRIPEELNSGIFQHIQKADEIRRRRNLWAVWSIVSLVSVALIFLPIGIFHFLSIDLWKMFGDIFPAQAESAGHFPTLTVIVGAIAVLLLFIDNRLRKFFLR